jgi:peptidoglycan-N-acetylglucosamine deacetylase
MMMHINPTIRPPLKQVLSNQAVVYLTFDDGPDPQFTPRLLDLLERFQVTASFFVVGRACRRYPDLLKRIAASGHSVGNHTHTHCHPWRVGNHRARQEVRKAFETITTICAAPPRLFRPPYGRLRKAMLEEAATLRMETVLWSRSAIDWGIMATRHGIGRRLEKVRAGDIVLCHDAPSTSNRPELTLATLPTFIENCQRRQLRFAGLDELPRGNA